MLFDYIDEVVAAEKRIRQYLHTTPLDLCSHLSEIGNCRAYLKLEHLQRTGSFKFRGAMNKILSLSQHELKRGVIAASTGNHGMAVAYAAKKVGTHAKVFVPNTISEGKRLFMQSLAAETIVFGKDCLEAEGKAREIARQSGLCFISPYNDRQVIAGQGTIGIELRQQLNRIDAVFVSVGGGGLISEIASFLKAKDERVRIVGCLPEAARSMYESLRAGRIMNFPDQPTLSDSTAGGIESGSITFDLCQTLVDETILVTEDEIRQAMAVIRQHESWVIEGAAGVAVAGYLKEGRKYEGKNCVIVLCGGNTTFINSRGNFTC